MSGKRRRKPGSRAVVIVVALGASAVVAWLGLSAYVLVTWPPRWKSPRAGAVPVTVFTREEVAYVRNGVWEYARDRRELDRWMHLWEVDRRTRRAGSVSAELRKSARNEEELERYLAMRWAFDMMEECVRQQRFEAAIVAQNRRAWEREADRMWEEDKVMMPRR